MKTKSSLPTSGQLSPIEAQSTDQAAPLGDRYVLDLAREAETLVILLWSKLLATLTPEQGAMLITHSHLAHMVDHVLPNGSDTIPYFDLIPNGYCDADMENAKYLLTGFTQAATQRAAIAACPHPDTTLPATAEGHDGE